MSKSTVSEGAARRPERPPARARAIAYALFMLIGMLVLRLQWHLAFDVDRSGLLQPYAETLLLVPLLALIACLAALAGNDRMLKLVAGATLVIIALQLLVSLAPSSQRATDALNALARVYGFLCIFAWPAGFGIKSWTGCIALLAVLLVVVVPLSLAWNVQRQALTNWRRTAGTLELQLYAAAEGGDLPQVRSLLVRGARLDITGDGGWDALMHAAAGGDPAIVNFLLAHGADPNTREDRMGSRPLPPSQASEMQGRVLVSGRTALITAAVHGHTEAVRALLAAGADPAVRDVNGKTALDWAMWANRPDVVLLLRESHAGR
jgi:hypothetical protein